MHWSTCPRDSMRTFGGALGKRSAPSVLESRRRRRRRSGLSRCNVSSAGHMVIGLARVRRCSPNRSRLKVGSHQQVRRSLLRRRVLVTTCSAGILSQPVVGIPLARTASAPSALGGAEATAWSVTFASPRRPRLHRRRTRRIFGRVVCLTRRPVLTTIARIQPSFLLQKGSFVILVKDGTTSGAFPLTASPTGRRARGRNSAPPVRAASSGKVSHNKEWPATIR